MVDGKNIYRPTNTINGPIAYEERQHYYSVAWQLCESFVILVIIMVFSVVVSGCQ
jgi:hypothetical protein